MEKNEEVEFRQTLERIEVKLDFLSDRLPIHEQDRLTRRLEELDTKHYEERMGEDL